MPRVQGDEESSKSSSPAFRSVDFFITVAIPDSQACREAHMSWLLPVGTPGGITSGFEGIPDGSGIVKLADKLGCLDPDQYRLWRAAAAAPQAEDLVEWAASRGIADAARRVR